MRYIEIVDDNGLIVGVETVEKPDFVKYSKRHDIFVGCTEDEAQGIFSTNSNTIYQLKGREQIKGIRNDIVLSAFFIDKDEYDRLVYLSENPEQPKQDDIEENTDVVNNKQPEILTMAQVAIELQNIKADVANLQSSAPLNDDATVKFYETLSDSSTNSIAKIRAAAQQYLDDTATYNEVM